MVGSRLLMEQLAGPNIEGWDCTSLSSSLVHEHDIHPLNRFHECFIHRHIDMNSPVSSIEQFRENHNWDDDPQNFHILMAHQSTKQWLKWLNPYQSLIKSWLVIWVLWNLRIHKPKKKYTTQAASCGRALRSGSEPEQEAEMYRGSDGDGFRSGLKPQIMRTGKFTEVVILATRLAQSEVQQQDWDGSAAENSGHFVETELGFPEWRGVSQRPGIPRLQLCSMKTNIGNAIETSGIASLIKTLHSIRRSRNAGGDGSTPCTPGDQNSWDYWMFILQNMLCIGIDP